jgi:catechol 2,3-dioxygenase-like lactoylglutathione lyase family enzyme
MRDRLTGATGGETMAKIRHIAYRVDDTEAMATFLIDAFEMTVANRRGNGVIDMSDGSINLTLIPCNLRGPVMPRGLHHIGFTDVDNDAARKRVIAAGGVEKDTTQFTGVFYEVKYDGPQGMVVDVGHWQGAAPVSQN